MKRYVSYGPGYSGDHSTYEKARAAVEKNHQGAVYSILPFSRLPLEEEIQGKELDVELLLVNSSKLPPPISESLPKSILITIEVDNGAGMHWIGPGEGRIEIKVRGTQISINQKGKYTP